VSANHILQNFLSAEKLPEWKLNGPSNTQFLIQEDQKDVICV
jgi:hypothetical protein